jgi:hypothetical protein
VCHGQPTKLGWWGDCDHGAKRAAYSLVSYQGFQLEPSRLDSDARVKKS